MTIEPRPYSGADDLTKMQQMIAESTAQAGDRGYLHVGDVPHRLYNALRKYDPAEVAFLWEDAAGDLQGWSFIYPKDPAYEIHVTPTVRDTPLEQSIYEWTEARTAILSQKEGKEPVIVTDWFEGDAARKALLEKLGYEFNEHVITLTSRSLLDPIPDPQLPPGFTIRNAAGDHEAAQLAAVHHGAFHSNWTPETYQKLMHTPGYDAEREMIVVAPDGQFAAFCIYWIDDLNKSGLFEPVGVHDDFQRRGLGRALMLATMQRLQAQGIETAYVGHEPDNPASTGLYAALGFQPKYQIFNYRKNVGISNQVSGIS